MSDTDIYNAFRERIALEGALRLRVQPLPQDGGGTPAGSMRALNASVLACVASLQDDLPVPDDDSAAARALGRMHARLDILVELLTRALDTDAQLPRPVAARLNTVGLDSDAVPDLPAGSAVRVSIHFDACRALALRLDGRIAAGGERTFVAFDALDDATRDALDGLVFRHHRRGVARSRR